MLYPNLCLFVLFGTITLVFGGHNDKIYSAYVTFDNNAQTFAFCDAQPADGNYVAVAHMINATANQTGWTYLEVDTIDYKANDSMQAYAAGLAEGFLTRDLIHLHGLNILESYCVEPYNRYCLKLRDFLSTNLAWVREQIESHPADSYWHQVAMYYTQLQGLSDGYHGTPGSISMDVDPLGLYLLQLYFDLGDLEHSLGANDMDIRRRSNEHCSAIIKLTPGNRNLYTAHNTWASYSMMLRILKKYSLKYHMTESSDSKHPPGRDWTFSSYPGFLTSGDDFHLLSSGMVTMETTIPIYNNSLWKLIKPTGIVLEPIRSWSANRLAESGEEWVAVFGQYNSGTYNNKWMVIDYKLFEPASMTLKPGLLTVLEQLPDRSVPAFEAFGRRIDPSQWTQLQSGLFSVPTSAPQLVQQRPCGFIRHSDVTNVLQEQGYWAAYNLPYFPDVLKMSGFAAKFDKFGDHFSYDNCPRAKIFRRDHSSITDRASLYRFMRYNDYLHDPLSRSNCTPIQNANYAISARNDLNPENGTYLFQILGHSMLGAYDVKMTSQTAMKWLQMEAAAGPTYDQVPPFQWSKQSKEDNVRHLGQPDLFQFEPIYFNGTNPVPYPVQYQNK